MQKLYAVQLKPCYRFLTDYDTGYDRATLFSTSYIAVFKNRKQSELFVLVETPNFAPTFYHVFISYTSIHIFHDYRQEIAWLVNWEVFYKKIQNLKLPDPDNWYDINALIDWWNVVCATHNANQIEYFRTVLELPDWGQNPFASAHIEGKDGDFGLIYAPSLLWLSDFAKACQFPEPERTPEAIHAWWTEYFPQMTPEQQRALWHWFDPEPFFITEIELEGDLPCSLA
jgi:hypothetical protein